MAVLAYFKYAQFLAANLNQVLPGAPFPEINHDLPLGISFFTFQLISYAFDVYRRQVPAERGLDKFAVYILMFPHLIAGPIVRFAAIRDELHANRRKTAQLGLGVQYFIVGLCQKVLIANTLAPVADFAFGAAPGSLDRLTAWTGVAAYGLQIYFDFCGYSNMAIGLAFMLGFTFPKNFNYPYAAQSITEFWRRWHMSLSSWFRDYVYIPLGGNRGGLLRTVRNLLTVFLLTGLWHGAAWNFIVWGLFHGAFLMIERFGFDRVLDASPRLLRHAYAMLVVLIAWVFFRAVGLRHALSYLADMFSLSGHGTPGVAFAYLMNAQVLTAFVAGALLSFPLLPRLMDRLQAPRIGASPHLSPDLDTRNVHAIPVLTLVVGFVLSVAMLANSSLNPFLYFRF
ncbi:MBOAT family protein [Phenylobacterium sp.]|uniref:MBOAT family O-acyltransferase n=1 Tax=Phenylobacterium sp. TaxID=1871053 RepID=UPI002733E957|nr:MBOAT family O-acyltransferase [Phenylobacterium sp.]